MVREMSSYDKANRRCLQFCERVISEHRDEDMKIILKWISYTQQYTA